MKTVVQFVLVLLVVAGGVGAFTFMSQYTRKPPEVRLRTADATPVAGKPTVALTVPEKVAVWDSNDPAYAAEYEKGAPGSYDFWLANTNTRPAEINLAAKGCTCSEVQLGLLDSSTLTDWVTRLGVHDVAANLAHGPNLAAALTAVGIPQKIKWEKLRPERDHKPQVPAAVSPQQPQLAVLRLKWETKEPRPMRLTAVLDHRVEDLVEQTTFEVPINGVIPMILSASSLNAGDMNYNEVRDLGFFVWSATRPSLDLSIEEILHDPCTEVLTPRRLNDAELAELPQKVTTLGARPKCGYFVGVKVYERKGQNQLDLGPILRKIVVRSGPDSEAAVMVSGFVRGSIRVGEPADKDRIELGNFKSASGTDKTVVVTSTDTSIDLKVESFSPETLHVALAARPPAGGRKQWELRVEAAPNALAGMLPPTSAVVLQMQGPNPRRVRVPIAGQATY